MSAFPYIEAWITKPASTTVSSEPGSEISSFVDSGDDLSEKLVVSTTGPLVEDLVVQNSNGVNTNMAGTALPSTKHNTVYCCAIECSGHAQRGWVVLYAAHLHATSHSGGHAAH